MPSIFSRSRTQSTPFKPALEVDTSGLLPMTDEFGRVNSRSSANHPGSPATPTGTTKKTTKKNKGGGAGGGADAVAETEVPMIPDGTFLPLNLDRKPPERPRGAYGAGLDGKARPYGHLSHYTHVILGLEQVARLVDVCCEELGTRGGLTTPFIFSSLANEISRTALHRLIDSFLATCKLGGNVSADAERRWRDEARFAGMHELALCLRWGLARALRIWRGVETRGLVDWEHYKSWRDVEAEQNYPATHFTTFLSPLSPPLRSIILTVLSLLTRLTAHSASSGYTPPTLSPLFGPLIFGLGPGTGPTVNPSTIYGGLTPITSGGTGAGTLPFHHTYLHYLDAANATEHILLAFIRWQDSPRLPSGQLPGSNGAAYIGAGAAAALSVPTRLKEWIMGYPQMLPALSHPLYSDASNQYATSFQLGSGNRPQPRKGARTVRVLSVRRNVRMYSGDLVRTCASWAQSSGSSALVHSTSSGRNTPMISAPVGGPGGLAGAKEWDRICPPVSSRDQSNKMPPKYAEAFKKRLALSRDARPELGAILPESPVYGLSLSSSTSSYLSSSLPSPLFGSELSRASSLSSTLSSLEGSDSGHGTTFRSLTDLKWGEFESMGFGGLGSDAKDGGMDRRLMFDLTEGARNERLTKRQTLSWDDFQNAGFGRSDAPLSATLQFSVPSLLPNSTGFPQSLSSQFAAENSELTKKLRKQQKRLPGFGWDTEPVVGQEEVIEESFLDVFCDLLYGGGWGWEGIVGVPPMSEGGGAINGGGYGDEWDRECNWALVEFKSVPVSQSRNAAATIGGDPRSSSTLLLFEEYVPQEYRQQLAAYHGYGASARRRLPSLFSSQRPSPSRPSKMFTGGTNKSGKWKPAPTLNGRPYVPGNVPSTPPAEKQRKEVEFEGMLKAGGGNTTKIISLGGSKSGRDFDGVPADSSGVPLAGTLTEGGAKDDDSGSGSIRATPSKKGSRFRLPTSVRKSMMAPAEYSSVDFETRITGPETSSSESLPNIEETLDPDEALERDRKRREKAERRQSRGAGKMNEDDAWVDILVGSQSRRLGGQDAILQTRKENRRKGIGLTSNRDPDLASQEVAQALAGVRDPKRSFSPDNDVAGEYEGAEPYGPPYEDEDVDEIETIPRARESYADTELDYGTENDTAQEDDGDDETSMVGAILAQHRQRRMGYFDLHPERRPQSAGDRYDDYSDDEDIVPVPKDITPAEPVRPLPHIPKPPSSTSAMTQSAKRELPVSNKDNGPAAKVLAGGNAQSKTASLIEMYREKERAAGASTAGASPSRLPVRSSASVAQPQPIAAVAVPPQHDDDLSPPARPALDDSGRSSSPGRYIHGAPLHNVLEEEEDEY